MHYKHGEKKRKEKAFLNFQFPTDLQLFDMCARVCVCRVPVDAQAVIQRNGSKARVQARTRSSLYHYRNPRGGEHSQENSFPFAYE